MTNLPHTLIKYRKYKESYSRSTGLKTRHDEIPRLIRRNLRELAHLELDETEACLFYYVRYLPRQINLETLDQALVVCRKVTEALREIANCTKTKRELNRLEAFLNLHLASAAMASGKRSLARDLYCAMARHVQRPFGALARYCITFLGDDFWKKLQRNRY